MLERMKGELQDTVLLCFEMAKQVGDLTVLARELLDRLKEADGYGENNKLIKMAEEMLKCTK